MPPAPAGPDFSGTFTSDKVSVELSADGQGGFSGLITMGASKLPASGSVQNGNLVGKFQSGAELRLHRHA